MMHVSLSATFISSKNHSSHVTDAHNGGQRDARRNRDDRELFVGTRKDLAEATGMVEGRRFEDVGVRLSGVVDAHNVRGRIPGG